ncbi:MAG: polysaccharide deacetylase family protein, partial [Bacillota bacterium]|nr:polysaccharide deacetylase family protein [Bacillota bacterium]
TLEILPILDRYNIKATFFVIGKTDKKSLEILKKIADSGHSIGIHTYSHNYNRIYQSVESYLDDFKKMYDVIYQNTNVKPDIFRFAGGSISAYNSHLYKPLIAEMTRRGFSFYDWNACGNDAMGNATKASIIEDSVSKLRKDKRYILLMHDSATMKATVSALPEIIERIEDKGFTFDKLTSEVKPIAFAYPD